MAAPTFINWDTNDTETAVPDAGHQSDGWAVLEKPQVQYMNWMLKNIYEWIAYLDVGFPIVTNITAQTSVTIAHNLGRPIQVVVFDASGGIGNVIGPDTINCTTLNSVTVTFAAAQSGSIVIF